jgi:hypothetical protein
VVQYSSGYFYCEGGAKNPLKSISVKLLVLASYAQLGVSAGKSEYLGNRNGIRIFAPSYSLRLYCVFFLKKHG